MCAYMSRQLSWRGGYTYRRQLPQFMTSAAATINRVSYLHLSPLRNERYATHVSEIGMIFSGEHWPYVLLYDHWMDECEAGGCSADSLGAFV